jgi:hypothetical protein
LSCCAVRRHRLGPAMLDFARRYTDVGALSPTKAAKVLGVTPRRRLAVVGAYSLILRI